MDEGFIPCTIKHLPDDKVVDAAKIACRENPVNAPPVRAMSALGLEPTPLRAAIATGKYWGTRGVKLGVTFLDTQEQALKNLILSHMNAWNKTANVEFHESAQGEVRIARVPGQGYWSYLGTDILSIPGSQQTMNLDSFSLQTPESEFYRVVRHETGHTLGMPHEHLRAAIVADLDPAKTVQYFMATQGWTERDVYYQVLTPVSERSLLGPTPADRQSIMCYYLPASITKSGQPIPGGNDIDPSDYAYVAKVYPKDASTKPPPPPETSTWQALLKRLLELLDLFGVSGLAANLEGEERQVFERRMAFLENDLKQKGVIA